MFPQGAIRRLRPLPAKSIGYEQATHRRLHAKTAAFPPPVAHSVSGTMGSLGTSSICPRLTHQPLGAAVQRPAGFAGKVPSHPTDRLAVASAGPRSSEFVKERPRLSLMRKADDGVVRVADDNHVARRLGKAPAMARNVVAPAACIWRTMGTMLAAKASAASACCGPPFRCDLRNRP